VATSFPDAMDDPRVITAATRVNVDFLQTLDDQLQGLGRGVVGLTSNVNYGSAIVTVADAGTTQVSEADSSKRLIRLIGTLTAARAVQLAERDVGYEWVVTNGCNYDVAVSSGSSSATTVPAGDTVRLMVMP